MRSQRSSYKPLRIAARLDKRIAKVSDYVRCDHRPGADCGSGNITGEPVQIHRSDRSRERIFRPLSNKRSYHSSQNIARPAGGHAGVTRSTYIDLAIRRGYNSRATLGHQDHLAIDSELQRDV